MSYATLMVYVNVDHVSKQLVGVAAGLADKFSAKLIGLSALAIMPPFVAEGVVIVDNATEFDIAKMKARLAEAGNKISGRPPEPAARSNGDRPSSFRPQTLIERSAMRRFDRGRKRQIGRYLSDRRYRCGHSGSRTSLPGGACGGQIPCRRPCRGRVEGYAGGAASRPGRVAVPSRGEARDHHGDLREGPDGQSRAITSMTSFAIWRGTGSRPNVGSKYRRTDLVPIRSSGFAEDEGADLLVTGAYGHNRLNEWVFGGMTRDLLSSSPICCLMSH